MLIDNFSEEAFYFKDSDIRKYKTSLEKYVKKLNISRKYFQKKSLLEGVFVVLEKTSVDICELTDEMCETILDDDEIKATQIGGTISLTNMNKRWKRLYEILSGHDK